MEFVGSKQLAEFIKEIGRHLTHQDQEKEGFAAGHLPAIQTPNDFQPAQSHFLPEHSGLPIVPVILQMV
ncbi:hypothetical protein LNQ52_07250 [Klebsiella pneumoniae subsp. pneumoniae]|nr:hypothetical protein [Klebsiella pneumoniae subsp. pneumoniae]